jgi:Skp family chaperone for outer membrane proteins
MSSTIQSLTLGLAIAAAGFAGAAFVTQADANRAIAPYEQGMAFVDVFGLIDEIVKGEAYEVARAEFDAAQQGQLTAMQTQMQQLQAQLQVTDPSSPEAQGIQQQGMQLQQQMQQFYQRYQNGLEQLVGTQIGEAYQLIYAAAREEASEQGINFLFASRPDDNLLVDSLSGVAQEILARPLIAPASSVDLTADVRERLGLQDPASLELEIDNNPDTPAASDDPASPENADPMNEDPMNDDG